MSGLFFQSEPDEITVLAGVKKTIYQIRAPDHQGIYIWELSVAFVSGSPDDAQVLVEGEVQSSDGTGGVSLSFLNDNPLDSQDVQCTGLQNINGTQPTVVLRRISELVRPEGGYTWQAPDRKPIYVPGGKRFGLAVTAPINNACKTRASVEE